MLTWKRISKDRIRSGDYVVMREDLWGEITYLAQYRGETLTVCYEAETAKAKCELHAQTVPELDLAKTADER